jgi:hypothetical protein
MHFVVVRAVSVKKTVRLKNSVSNTKKMPKRTRRNLKDIRDCIPEQHRPVRPPRKHSFNTCTQPFCAARAVFDKKSDAATKTAFSIQKCQNPPEKKRLVHQGSRPRATPTCRDSRGTLFEELQVRFPMQGAAFVRESGRGDANGVSCTKM